ncbi:glycoside hydrolase family 16 protein [uncultured Acetobacteroides sp.]|uniref:glycoside hydrolase family 16 protein n=1 Tax=uncultured Acetobacteroides sp. TaxID=1760811 RepID=UPI0029F59EBE|nr:glycoside hydrolase family 16 protein [uncultured Acetobacteroides sp.]
MLIRKRHLLVFMLSAASCTNLEAQEIDPYNTDSGKPKDIYGYQLVWNDEFSVDGKPSPESWKCEEGFVRNKELQWYQLDNAKCSGGVLTIEGRREKVSNPNYNPTSSDWKKNRQFAEYTSASIKSVGLREFLYGRFEIRAKIDVAKGAWPAIWTLGNSMEWPSCGEVDLLEYYIANGVPSILANVASGTNTRWNAKWNSKITPLSHFIEKDPNWASKFHVWRMDWTPDSINLYLDDELLNTTLLTNTLNADGSQPFHQPQYILLNLALGENGGDPSQSKFPITFQVDYVRVYQKK